jgi:hypothetical protein
VDDGWKAQARRSLPEPFDLWEAGEAFARFSVELLQSKGYKARLDEPVHVMTRQGDFFPKTRDAARQRVASERLNPHAVYFWISGRSASLGTTRLRFQVRMAFAAAPTDPLLGSAPASLLVNARGGDLDEVTGVSTRVQDWLDALTPESVASLAAHESNVKRGHAPLVGWLLGAAGTLATGLAIAFITHVLGWV